MKQIGYLTSLQSEAREPIHYSLPLGDSAIPLNDWLGRELEIRFLEEIACVYCGRKIKKTYNSGSCYPCFKKLPDNDLCIVKPHICHYDQGTCRDATFGEKHCMQPHIVYLAMSSDIKVGITRKPNMIRRWMDQGAVEALPLLEVPTRKIAGEIEHFLSQYIKDKTDWRKMLKNETTDRDIWETRSDMIGKLPETYLPYLIENPELHRFSYPVLDTPAKVTSISLDKQPTIRGKLIGVKAQYLLLDTGVFSVRKHAGYKVAIEA